MNKKTTDIVAYFSVIGWAIAYYFGARSECKFHLNQALVLAIAEVAVTVLEKIAKIVLLGWVFRLASAVLFVLWLIGLIAAIQGQEKSIPILGGIRILY